MISIMQKTDQLNREAPNPSDVATGAVPVPAPERPAPGPWAVSIGQWIHRNKDITANPVGYTGYQVLRSVAAAVPYGVSMPVTFWGMLKLTEQGEALEKAGQAAGSAWKEVTGRNIGKFAASGPVRASAMIASSFSFYRGVSKLGAWTKQQLFDPDDTQAQTIEKTQYYWTDLGNKIREVAPAEFNSTPLAAIVLGYITSSFNVASLPEELKWNKMENIQAAAKSGSRVKFMKNLIFNPNARFVHQAAINTIGYSLFFELGDRLYKDVQLRRNLWQGDPNNINPKPGVSEATVSLEDDQPQERRRMVARFSEEYQREGKVDKPDSDDKVFGFFTDEPSIGRFLFRRVLPTSVGISAYTAFKFRHAYMWLGGPFPDIKSARDIPKNIWREGGAVTLFFLIPLVADPWSKLYDNFFTRLENWAKGKPSGGENPPPPQAEQIITNNEQLLERLNEKERGTGLGR